MDEPTAALAVREVESVLKLIRQMRDEGIAVVLISHRLNDVFEVTDRIVVLRQGRIEADLATKKTQDARSRQLHRRRPLTGEFTWPT